jgi:hypothetical protein
MANLWQTIVSIIQGLKAGTWAAVVGGIMALVAAIFHGPVVDAIVAAYTAIKGLWGG